MSAREPALKPTQPATLVVAALAAAAVTWLLISNFYQQLPPMIWPPAILIMGIAVFEAAVARNLWGRIHGRSGLLAARRAPASRGRGEPVEPLAVVRFAVLAKASSVAAAILIGAYAGFLPWLAIEAGRLSSAAADLPPSVGGLVASGALLAAAQWLERACRVPEEEERDREEPERPELPDRRDEEI